MYKKTHHHRGFTMLELLLYIGLLGIIMGSIAAFTGTVMESRIKNQTVAEVEQQGIQVMQQITQTIRNSTAINSPAIGTSASSLSVTVPTGANSPTLFSLSSGQILMQEGANPAGTLTSARVVASGLNFQNLSRTDTPGTLRVSFTLTHANTSGKNIYSFNKTFVGSASLRYTP